jgi:hypothetical protein
VFYVPDMTTGPQLRNCSEYKMLKSKWGYFDVDKAIMENEVKI